MGICANLSCKVKEVLQYVEPTNLICWKSRYFGLCCTTPKNSFFFATLFNNFFENCFSGLPLKPLLFEPSLASNRAVQVVCMKRAHYIIKWTSQSMSGQIDFFSSCTSHLWPSLTKFYPFYPSILSRQLKKKKNSKNLACVHARSLGSNGR